MSRSQACSPHRVGRDADGSKGLPEPEKYLQKEVWKERDEQGPDDSLSVLKVHFSRLLSFMGQQTPSFAQACFYHWLQASPQYTSLALASTGHTGDQLPQVSALALLPTAVWGQCWHPPSRPSPLGQQNEGVAGAMHQTHNGVAVVVPVDDKLAPAEAAREPADSNGGQARRVLGKRDLNEKEEPDHG